MHLQNLPYLWLLAAAILIYAPRLVVIRELRLRPEGYDNRLPRHQQKQLEGLGARAQGAHENSFEAFLLFAAGVLACEVSGVAPGPIAWLGGAFVVARVVWLGCYLADQSTARSLVWAVGFGASLLLVALPTLR